MKLYSLALLMLCATPIDAMLTKSLLYKVLISKQLQSYPPLNQIRSFSQVRRVNVQKKEITNELRKIDKILQNTPNLTPNEIVRLQNIKTFQERSINGLHWRYATITNHNPITALSPNKQLIATAEPISGGYGYCITIERALEKPFFASVYLVDIKEIQFLLFNGDNCIVLKGKTYTNAEITKYIEAVSEENEKKWLEKLLPASIISLWIASYAYDLLKFING